MKIDERVISHLFFRMRNSYGSRWVMVFGNSEQIEAGKADWLDKLKRYSANDIAKTLDHVKEIHPGNPPDIEAFVKLLKSLKGHRPGHLSKNMWETRTAELKANKANIDLGQEYLRKIKQENGL